MMMALGLFVFMRQTLPYQEFQRQTDWRHPTNSRVGARPASQFLGVGDDKITLSGVLVPEIAGARLSLDLLRLMADQGMAWPLVEGSGRLHGLFVIESLSETGTLHFRDGAPRRIEFSLALKRVDDGLLDLLGSVVGAVRSLL